MRIFIADQRRHPDPDPNLTIEQVRDLMADFLPDLVGAQWTATQEGEDTIIDFQRRTGTKGEQCVAKGCPNRALFHAVDNQQPMLERTPMPVCRGHALRWNRRGGIWIFQLPEFGEEAESLSNQQIRDWTNPAIQEPAHD